MRALVVDGGEVRLQTNRSAPVPGRGEALVRALKVAVGEMDVQISRGLMGFSGVLGHEFVGRVEAVADRDEALVGQRVVGSIDVTCGECDMCMAGLGSHCRRRTVMGMSGRDGCLAEYFTLPARNLVVVPPAVDDEHAVFAHRVAAALQGARQLALEGKPYVTVLGDGPLGLVTAQVMARLNASVRLIGRYSRNLSLCEKWGVKHRHVDDIGRRADQDVVVDCTGSPTGLELAMQLVRPRGKILLKTMIAPPRNLAPGVDLTPLVLNEIDLIGSRFGPMAEGIGAIARGEVEVVNLVDRRMSLNAGPEILITASQPGMLAVLVEV